MKLLVVSATEAEVGGLAAYLQAHPGLSATRLVAGVGMLATAYALTRHLQHHTYDLVLQAGVGGSFDDSIALGELVWVTADRYGDLGAEDHDNYIDIFDMGLVDANAHPHSKGWLPAPTDINGSIADLRQATGITVNTVSGHAASIARRRELYQAQTESMEGAAFHYVCLHEGVRFAQVRAISNYVIPRDKSQWKMKDAIINLNKWLIALVEEFAK